MPVSVQQVEKGWGIVCRDVECDPLPVEASVSRFRGQSGVDEFHLTLRPTMCGDFQQQLGWLQEAYQRVLDACGLQADSAILRRFFCSDLYNQSDLLKGFSCSDPYSSGEPCAVSWAGQPPLPPAKVSMWAYHVFDPRCGLSKTRKGPALMVQRGGLSHQWTTGITAAGETSYHQTRRVFEHYDEQLKGEGLSLADHVQRTWLFVPSIDLDYRGLVNARREFFAEHGLTPSTHFIASSGIGGACADISARVALDAYAIGGLKREQIEYLAAPDHLSPTHVYGVTFERGTSIAYQDRKHIILSGTASIDAGGNILHAGDVLRQLERTLENVDALLHQAQAIFSDVCAFIVYIRDPADHALVREQLRARFGNTPMQVVVGAVCRPGWLVEVEGLAIVPASNRDLPPF